MRESFRSKREAMVRHLISKGIRDGRVLEAMGTVPRERFVPDSLRARSYEDGPLPIGSGQTISQPYVVAWMLEALRLQPSHRVLEVGAGSGYAAAVLSRLVAEVYALERLPELVSESSRRLTELGFHNVQLKCADGTLGWRAAAPYHAILVSAAGPRIPHSLQEQLAVGGRMVIPVGSHRYQQLYRVDRTEKGFQQRELGGVKFVPLIGQAGF